MFDFAGWGTDLRKLLGDFTVAIQSLSDQLSRMPQTEAERKLEEYGKELNSGSDELSKVRAAYRKVVETFLNKFPPTFSNDFASNLRQYDKLIVFSLRSGDRALLEKWGIAKPRSQNLPWINDPVEKTRYVRGLEDLRDRAPGAEEYYDYLINHFR